MIKLSLLDICGGLCIVAAICWAKYLGYNAGLEEGHRRGWNEAVNVQEKLKAGWHWSSIGGRAMLIPPAPKGGPRR